MAWRRFAPPCHSCLVNSGGALAFESGSIASERVKSEDWLQLGQYNNDAHQLATKFPKLKRHFWKVLGNLCYYIEVKCL